MDQHGDAADGSTDASSSGHGTSVPEGPAGTTDDALVAARVALEGVGRLPLDERAVVFERVHATVVEELRQLELG